MTIYTACIDEKDMHAARIIWYRLDPAPDSNVTINQLVLREDLNERLNAQRIGGVPYGFDVARVTDRRSGQPPRSQSS